MAIIVRECPECGKITKLTVPEKAFILYNENGVPAAEAFPDMTIDERTTVVFGLCSDCIKNFEPYSEE